MDIRLIGLMSQVFNANSKENDMNGCFSKKMSGDLRK